MSTRKVCSQVAELANAFGVWGQLMSPSFIGSSGKHNGDALLYQTDEHRGVGGRRIGS
jgi:hypothetical protein